MGRFDFSQRDLEFEENILEARVEWKMIEKRLYKYEGEVKLGTETRHGWGTCSYRQGDQFWGYWKDGKIFGHCRYIYADGTAF